MSRIKAQHQLILLLTLASFFVAYDTIYTFDTTKPLLYIPLDTYVVLGMVKYSIVFKWQNPCEMLPTPSQIYNQNSTELDRALFYNMKQQCNDLYSQSWMSKLSKIKNAKVEGFIDDALEMNTTVGPKVWENTTQWGYDDIGRAIPIGGISQGIPPIVPIPDDNFRPRSEMPDLYPWEQKEKLVEDFDKYAHYRILRNRRETSSNVVLR